MRILLLAFVVVPVVELVILVELGRYIGTLRTVGLVVATGITGVALAQFQGFGVLSRMKSELLQGRFPGEPLLDGLLVLAGALLLVTPGLLTDLAGLAMLFPPTRVPIKGWLKRKIRRMIDRGEMNVFIRR